MSNDAIVTGPASDDDDVAELPRSSSSSGLEMQNIKKKKRKESDAPAEGPDSVSKQTEALNTPGTIWYSIKKLDTDTALRLIKKQPKLLYERGAVGDTPLHLMFLFNTPKTLDLAKTVIELFPEIITVIYEHPIYQGETVLHIAIVNRDVEMVKWLVSRERKLLSLPAEGQFFQGESPCYYGEYPLAFAASTNNIPILDYLISQGADLHQADSSGNTLAHMCVIHGHQKMLTHIREAEKKKFTLLTMQKKELPKPLLKMKNNDGFTPLTLAAMRGSKDIFDFILISSKENQWTYGPIACNVYPLDELDTLQPAKVDDVKNEIPSLSALAIIVQQKHLPLLMLPRVVDLLHMKWKAYAARHFYYSSAATLGYIVLLTIATILRFPDFGYENDAGSVGRAFCEVFVVIGWAYRSYKELQLLRIHGRKYFTTDGSAFIRNNINFLFCISFFCALISEACQSQVKLGFTFLAVLLAWTYLWYLLLGFKLMGPFVIMINKMWRQDVARFFAIYILVLCGHSVAFYAIQLPGDVGEFTEFFLRLERDFYILFGQIDYDADFGDVMRPEYVWLASILLTFHIIFCFLVLLNILIAMLGDTFGEVKENAEQEWHLVYAEIILSLETEIGPHNLQECEYWANIDGKRFLQVQEVDKKYFGKVVEHEPTITEFLSEMDLDNDGKISLRELEIGEKKLREAGLVATINLKEGVSIASPTSSLTSGNYQAPTDRNLGPQDVLEGRLDPNLLKVK